MPNNEWGDFQTPAALAAAVVEALPARAWARVLEPTCGLGRFLVAAESLAAVERLGIEAQPAHVAAATAAGLRVLRRDVFTLDLARDLPWTSDGPLLVLGNPPWVTNAQLGAMGALNVPAKSNVRGLRGLDAITGAANFDVAEFVCLKLMLELQAETPTIALLVKTQVARNVLSYAAQFALPYSDFTIRSIDAKAWFGAAVDACLFVVAHSERPRYVCAVYPSLESAAPSHTIGVVDGRLVADLERYERASFADGRGPVEWRSGIKHDAAAVMETTVERARALRLEPEYVLPLLKGTDVFRGRLGPTRALIVPQRCFGEDTAHLAVDAPALWSYLTAHAPALDGRRSAIYRGRPRFGVFGLGAYTFAPYKIAVSGLHAAARFAVVGPHHGRPVVFDDTCYLLPFADGAEAVLCLALLRSAGTRDLLAALVFPHAKRPITKRLLQRLDLRAIAAAADRSELAASATAIAGHLGLAPPPDWHAVADRLLNSGRASPLA